MRDSPRCQAPDRFGFGEMYGGRRPTGGQTGPGSAPTLPPAERPIARGGFEAVLARPTAVVHYLGWSRSPANRGGTACHSTSGLARGGVRRSSIRPAPPTLHRNADAVMAQSAARHVIAARAVDHPVSESEGDRRSTWNLGKPF